MKKSVLDKVTRLPLILMILISLLFLTSCGGKVPAGETPMETSAAYKAVQTGTQGVEIRLSPSYPPPLIYDQNELLALVEINNRGNYDLQAQDCFVQITGFDPNIITGGFNIPRSCAEGFGVLEGKNVYNLQGSTNQLEFNSPHVILPQRVFEYNPLLNFITCYNYQTTAAVPVCVDPLFYQVTSEQKSCTPHNVGAAGGQGGPVGVSSIGVNMMGGKAMFEINIANLGSGQVLSPYSPLQNCGQASIEYSDLDKVRYDVKLSGGSLINCKPRDHFVRLNNGNGKIVCSFNIPGASAYETPLIVDLDYNYVQSYTRPVKIVKTPQ
tara:strand:- start:148 stop:1122 length:975 start_codon:yes stop_codon:yes gene_type:complete